LSNAQYKLADSAELLTESSSGASPSSPRITLIQHDLRVHGFGAGRVYRQDELVSTAQWGWSIPREMFFYILTKHQATRAQIGMIFWADTPQNSMQSSFHNAKFAIKNAIGKPVMVYVNGSYSINPELDYLYDVHSFEYLIANSSQSLAAEAMADLLEAARLFQDDFLVDLSSEWIDQTRSDLSAKFFACCVKAGTIALSMQTAGAVVEILERAIQRDPLNEEIARLLMSCQWKSGKHRAAMDTYSNLEDTLQRELGIRPETATEQLLAS